MTHRVLVTGVSRLVGVLAVAALAADPAVERIVAVDEVAPLQNLGRAQFLRADIRNPVIGKILDQERIDTVVHLGVIVNRRNTKGRGWQKETNVIGTMQLLGACQRAESVRRLVVKSSSAVYGASFKDPAMFTEEMSARRAPTSGFGLDCIEVENYVRGFSRRRNDVEVTVLRMANIVGPGLDTWFTDLFRLPVLPIPLGFDGRFQVLHLQDAVDAVKQATVPQVDSRTGGIFNIAGEGVMTIRQAARIAQRPVVRVLPGVAPLAGRLASAGGAGTFEPEQSDFLQFGRGLDTTRMRRVMGFRPRFSTMGAFREVFAK